MPFSVLEDAESVHCRQHYGVTYIGEKGAHAPRLSIGGWAGCGLEMRGQRGEDAPGCRPRLLNYVLERGLDLNEERSSFPAIGVCIAPESVRNIDQPETEAFGRAVHDTGCIFF